MAKSKSNKKQKRSQPAFAPGADIRPIPNCPNAFIDFNNGTIIKLTRDGFNSYAPLPVITSLEVCEDEIATRRYRYVVQIGEVSATLTDEDFLKPDWVANFPDLHGIATRAVRELYVNVIRLLAQDAPKEYLRLQQGIICEDLAGVRTHFFLSKHTEVYGKKKPQRSYRILDHNNGQVHDDVQRLPNRRLTEDELTWLIDALFILAPKGQLIVDFINNLCPIIGAPLPNRLRASHSLFHCGLPGSGKTSSSSLARSVVYPYDHKRGFDVSIARSTLFSAEQDIKYAGETPMVFDDDQSDNALQSLGKTREVKSLVMTIINAVYDRDQLRGRGGRDGRKRESTYINACPIFTGLRFPSMNDSALRRLLILRFTRGDFQYKNADLSKVEDIFKQIYATVARYVVNVLNESREESYTESYERAYNEIKRDFENSLNAVYSLTDDYRESLAVISSHILMAAKFLDNRFNLDTSEGFFARLKPVLLETAITQLQFSSGYLPNGEMLSDAILFGALERLEQGKKTPSGLWMIVGIIADSEDAADWFGFVDSTFDGTTEHQPFRQRGRDTCNAYYFKERRAFVFQSDFQNLLLTVANEDHDLDIKRKELFAMLRQDGRIEASTNGMRSQIRFPKSKKFASGWIVVNANDEMHALITGEEMPDSVEGSK